ncbi:MAG: ATP-binding protein [Bacteroides sp.]|nr:ATP-binding protein [Ruminococcus flavefaciens]MCM1554049.1 ATP-binding protein [Bacteroides sp.]
MKLREKINLMLEAVENGDYTFRFPENKGGRHHREFNAALNRIARIISDTKQEIRQNEIFYEQVLQTVETGIVVLDESDAVVQYNKAASKLLGVNMLRDLRQLERLSGDLASAVSTLGNGGSQTVQIHSERGKIQVAVRVSEAQIGQKCLRIVALNDIENELDEKEVDAWIRLTRVLTHEIMNSVTPVTSLSDTLLHNYAGGDAALRTGLQTIRDTGKGLLSFVESYRRFTRLPEPEPALFYVNAFLKRMLELTRHQAEDMPEVEVRMSVEPADLMVYADERLIGQVVLNILKNARQAIGKERTDGRITVRAYGNESGAVHIEIGNNGPKIDPELADEIFLPFFTTKSDGSGIGLAVSRQLMRLSGGSISLKSDDESTVFTLLFP